MNKNYEEVTKNILNGLNEFQQKGFYSREYFFEFEDRIFNMKDKIHNSMQESRLLKIGIVGEVKAGKSSFLNALVFDGEDILPKASTPMTAALTKITYAEKSSAKIVFYSEKDWDTVVNFSNEYDLEFERYCNNIWKNKTPKNIEKMRNLFNKEKKYLKLVSCKELKDLYDKSSIDLSDYLGTIKEIKLDDINSELQDYIGANGKFTSIVKHVELRMNNPMLKEVEIIDTPGLNDPIISRGEATKRFLEECDVVFLLSYCGQFLTQGDIQFICKTLPNQGVKDIVIVGSKFDSGILDDNKSKDIKTACNLSKKIYDKQAKENISKCLNSGYNDENFEKIEESLPPSYISSMLFSCAKKRKMGIEYSEQEDNIIKQLKLHFEDFNDDYKTLLSLSGINQIKRDKLQPIMAKKKEIIEEKNKNILLNNKNILLRLLEDINIQSLQNKSNLEKYNKDELGKKLVVLQSKLNSIRRDVRNIFEVSSVDAEKFLNNMKVIIEKEIDNFIEFDVSTHTSVEHGSYKTGFLGLRTEHYTETVTTYHASVSDVISNIRKYISRCKEYSNEEFDKIINLRKLESSIKETVIGAFDLSGDDFNENDILIPLEIVIKKIQIPKIDIEVSQFETMIIDEFSGASVEGNQIHELKLCENRVLDAIAKKIKEELDKCKIEIQNTMLEQANTFIDDIIGQLTKNIDALKNQIDDREDAIRQYNALERIIIEYKQMIRDMEV